MQVFYDIQDVNVPVCDDNMIYIYVLENSPQGNIKIGRSTNMQERLQSLSGSNSGGNKIVRCAVSAATCLYALERVAHQHFAYYRISGTEWFDGEQLSFHEAVAYIDALFASTEYKKCSAVRMQFMQQFT